MNQLALILHIALNKQLLIRALKIAFVVGIILNLINQGNSILSLDLEKINITKLLFTFCVPFCVSMYTAVTMKIKFHIGEKASANASLTCMVCKETSEIKENETIPCCEKCKEKTIWKIKEFKGQ